MASSCQPAPAFTLVEIMVVVVVIGLLASRAIPADHRVIARSQDQVVLNNLRQLSSAAFAPSPMCPDAAWSTESGLKTQLGGLQIRPVAAGWSWSFHHVFWC